MERTAQPKGPATPTEKPLNDRQRKFAEFYASTGNASRSVILAGYSPKSATTNAAKLLKNTQVQQYLTELAQAAQSSRVATAQERQEFWTDLMRGNITVVVKAKDGSTESYEQSADIAARLKASELLGKAQADFVERHELTGQAGGPIQQETAHSLEGKSIEELTALYKTWTR